MHIFTKHPRRIFFALGLLSCLLLSNTACCHPSGFKSESISKELLQEMEKGNSWSKQAQVPAERLKLLTVQHIDFNGVEKTGQIIVLDVCEDAVLKIFHQLHQQEFPIHQMRPLHHYNGDDHVAMNDNNSSCYIDRNIIGGAKRSLHAYGLAIDINPVQNPFVTMDAGQGIATYDPKASLAYANRLQNRLGKSKRAGMAEEVISVFAANGFYWWGGYWDTPLDYQHFQIDRGLAELYLSMDSRRAKSLFQTAVNYYNKHKQPLELHLLELLRKDGQKEASLLDYYTKDNKNFQACLNNLTT